VNSITLERVKYIPRELSPGILYVSIEYAVASHLCVCGCGNKVVTPLGPAEWTFSERNGRPTMYPSIGNWQLPCRSHYLITNGHIEWADRWSDVRVTAGRLAEEQRRQAHYKSLDRERGFWSRLWRLVRKLFGG
jgi:hypothetical protein